MELFAERGFEQTTVADIATRAGLTERTFFRHFADKREVLFGGSAELQDVLVGAVTEAPAAFSPLRAAAAGLEAAGGLLQERRAFARQRQAVIVGNTELQERELMKLAALAAAISTALRARGAESASADLVAEVAIAVFKTAFERWVEGAQPGEALPRVIRATLKELTAAALPG